MRGDIGMRELTVILVIVLLVLVAKLPKRWENRR